MLINSDINKPIYVIGLCPTANDMVFFVGQEHPNVVNISIEDFDQLAAGSQCMLGLSNPNRIDFVFENNVNLYVWPTFIHPSAVVIDPRLIGSGTFISPLTSILSSTNIGNFCFISQTCAIGHNSNIGDNVILKPGVTIGGSSMIGDNCCIGQRCIIKDKIKLADNIKLCMTSVVTRDLLETGTYYNNKKTNIIFQ